MEKAEVGRVRDKNARRKKIEEVCVPKGSGEQRNFEIHCRPQRLAGGMARKSRQTFCKGEEMKMGQRFSLHLDDFRW